ncbi:MAG: hypothetical protein AMXMBFR13_04810 [Phycisphaerae bacterium]
MATRWHRMMGTCLACVLLAPPAAPADVWDNIDVGIWTSDFNWADGTAPTATDEAIIDNGGTANVVFPGAVAQSLLVADGAVEVFSSGTLMTSGIPGPNGELPTDAIGYEGDGTVTVRGPMANWSSTNALVLGLSPSPDTPSNGTLNIVMGGTVESAAAHLAITSLSPGQSPITGTVSVRGDGSTWNVSGPIQMGIGGDSTLMITDGGTVTCNGIIIGLFDVFSSITNTHATATVDGTGSALTSATELAIRGDNSSLTVKNGGAVNVAGALHTDLYPTGGVLNIGDGGAPGFVNAASIQGDGSGLVNFNHTAADYYLTDDGTAGGRAVPIMDGTLVIHSGPGATTLSGVNSHTGGTFFNDGTIRVSSNDNLGGSPVASNDPTGRLNFDGGTLQTTANVALNGPTVLGDEGGTVDVVAGSEAIFAGLFENVITGADDQGQPITEQGHLTKTGGGTMILSGGEPTVTGKFGISPIPYSGGTTVESGTLRAGGADALPDNTDYTVNGGTLEMNAFALTMSLLSGTGGTVDLGNAPLTVNQAGVTSFAGTIVGPGTGNDRFTKLGPGTLTLSGDNTYGGGTVVRNGTLALNGGSIRHAGADTVVGSESGDDGTLAITGGATVSNFRGTVGFQAGSSGTVMVSGSGSTWHMDVNLFVGYSGTGTLTIADGGTVDAPASAALGFNGGAGTVNIGVGGEPGILDAPTVLGLGTATLNFDHSGNLWFTSDGTVNGTPVRISGTTVVHHVGSGTTTLLGDNAYTGGTTIDAGTLRISSDTNLGHAAGTLSFDGGTLSALAGFTMNRPTTLNPGGGTFIVSTGNLTEQQGDVSGAGKLTKRGNGTLLLSGTNSYAGGTTVKAGALHVTGSITHQGAVMLVGEDAGDDATLRLVEGDVTSFFSRVGFHPGSVGHVEVSGADSTWLNHDGLALNDLHLGLNGTGSLDVNHDGNVVSRDGTLGLFGDGHGSAVISDAGSVWLVNRDLIVGGEGTGELTVETDGIVIVPTITLARDSGSSGILNIGSGSSAGMVNAGSVHGGDGGTALNFNHNGSDYHFTDDSAEAGDPVLITGSTTVNHIGPGTTTLQGNQAYTGPTAVDNGTLLIDGAITDSTTTINPGGTLGGSGTVADVVVSGGRIAPGASAGMLTVDAVTFESGSTLAIELDGGGGVAGADFDQLRVNGAATIHPGATLVVSYLDAFSASPGDSFVVLTATTLTGSFDTLHFPAGQTWSITYNSSPGTITIGPCPDVDSDGVCNSDDLCPDTVPGAPVDSDGCPDPPIPADFDEDGDVDGDDVTAFEACASGPAIPLTAGCEDKDFDNDGDGDQSDFGVVQLCYSGQNNPGDPNCAP